MPLAVGVQVLIRVLVVLATLLLSAGTHSPWLALAAMIAACSSFYLTDWRKTYILSPSAASWLALAAVGATGIAIARGDRQAQVIAVANLQSYLQFVLLFQTKSPRVYWQLALMSLGQVAIACTLVSGPISGPALLLYLFVGCLTFAIVSMQAVGAGLEQTTSRGALPRPERAAPVSGARGLPHLVGHSAPLARRQAYSLARQALGITLLAVGFSALVFFAAPRFNVVERQLGAPETLRSIGFSKTVTLGELGEAVNNPDLVLRAQFFHGWSNRPFRLRNEPLFRGAVLNLYNGRIWTQADFSKPRVMPKEFKTPFVRQRLTIEPLDVAELFAVFPIFSLTQDRKLRSDERGEQIFRQEELRNRQVEFELGTTGIVDDAQRSILANEWRLDEYSLDNLLQMPESLGDEPEPLSGLRALAEQVLRDTNTSSGDRVAAARALSDYFHFSGQFSYTLEPQVRDARLDPLEDFVTRGRSGHCEYFAGALAMMLRSQGIPARIVVGFKGGEWNDVGAYYQVQQLHAHAWVEAYLEADQIPADALTEEDNDPKSAWLVLDPTEGTQENVTDDLNGSLLARLRHYRDYYGMLWNIYVVGLNSNRQRQGIYEPLYQGTSAALENLISPQVWQARMHALARSPVGDFWEWYRRYWFSWRGGLVAIAFSLVVVACHQTALLLTAFWRRLRGTSPLEHRPVHEIYRRLEAALAERGYRREPAQTAYEFAQAAAGDMAESLELRRLAHLPRRVVEAFYRVRFGKLTLDNVEAQAVEHALAELELALSSKR
jgi:protein-glutamine gamma-glutamyltransferase